MAIHVLRDPRPYLLSVMAVALVVMVPLMFAFITMTDRLFWPGAGIGTIALWALVGLVGIGLLGGLMAIVSRATRLSDAEHHRPDEWTP
jgi:hypothetical protein